MSTAAQRKGDAAEREIAALLHDLSGGKWRVRRALREGVADDCGDLDGLPMTCAQVRWWRDVLAAERTALDDVERQRHNGEQPFGVAFIRHPRKRWVVCMTPETFVALLREVNGNA